MSRTCCQHVAGDLVASARRPTAIQHSWAVIEWIMPTALLMLVPKCPACVAGYVLLWTGVGLSITAAGFLRTTLIVLCVAALVYLALRRIVRWTFARLTTINTYRRTTHESN
jgi:high-affinity Fe2+/Pb2+ permease